MVAAGCCLLGGGLPVLGGVIVSQASGYWVNPATWGGSVPGSGDDVTIAASNMVTLTNLSEVVVNSISVSGVLTHAANATTFRHRVNLQVTADLTVASGGSIFVDSRGYQGASGPGGTIDTGSTYGAKRCGASYGGKGAWGSDSLPGETYGSCLMPTNIGSGGSGYQCVSFGGGAVQLNVGGVTRIDGLISANGTNENVNANGGGSGGGIYLITSNLVGTGIIRANGAPAWNNNGISGGGGGGRVAVILTGSEEWGSVSIQAYGGLNGAYSGGAGTIYRATPSQAGGRGVVTVDNNGMTVNGYAELPGKLNPDLSNELVKAILVLTNMNTRLALTTNAVVKNILITTNASLVLGTLELTVKTLEHPLDRLDGEGAGATNRVDHYAQILWALPPRGTLLMVL